MSEDNKKNNEIKQNTSKEENRNDKNINSFSNRRDIRYTKSVNKNSEYLEKKQDEEYKEKIKYKENWKSKLSFRIISLILIITFICITIHIEMQSLKNNQESRESAVQITSNLYNSMYSLQDSWNTMYYFYQSGDLFNILNCRKNKAQNKKNDDDNLLVLYKDRIDKNIPINELNSVGCNKKITVNLAIKDDVDQDIEKDKEAYSFIIGEEPIDLLSKYPLLKYAIYKLKIGEKATIVARQHLARRNKIKKTTIYSLEILNQNNSLNIDKIIPHIIYNENAGKLNIKNQLTCNSNVNIKYTVRDVDGNELYKSDLIKINIGSGMFNTFIEQLLLKTHIGEEIKIFLSKKLHTPTPLLPKELFNNRDIIILDIQLYNIVN